MSSKNKLRFLICFLFSTLAHSSVLVASLFFSQQIVEDPQGATLKEAAHSLMQNSPKDQTVELVDLKQSKSAIPNSVQVAELARTLPEKNSAQREILLAKQDDPTAVEIKKQEMAKDADKTPRSEPIPQPVAKKPVKKLVETTPPKPKKVAKAVKPKTVPVVVAPVEKPVQKEKEKEDTVVAQNEELVPVRDHVDAEASEEAAAPVQQPAPEPKKPVIVQAAPVQEIERPQEETPVTNGSNNFREQQQAPKEIASGQDGNAESGVQSGGQGNGSSMGGSPQGIRDGDSLSELAGNIRPLYPLEDRRAKREGIAIFIARITADGKVKDIKLEGSATPAMNAAAQKAFTNYHYKPGQEGWVRKKFVFKITGETEEATGLRRTSQNNATSW